MFKRIQSIDDVVIEKITKLHSPLKNKIMIAVSTSGNMGLLWFAICLPFLINPPWRATGANIVFGLCIAHLMGEIIIKHIVKRTRPCHSLKEEEQIIHKPKYYSFPSGHTTASFSVLGVTMLRCSAPVVLAVLFLALLMGFSRIYLRVHYLSDVVAGAFLGFLCGFASVSLFDYFTALIF